ncbi:WD40 repeat domain-containing protein [Crocosphaera sp.]|uniref:WD40 repeat domain-containing protein n=1 Tax=Crocosphaera sp. TaxID=2729996 RepID=UPI003F2833AC|nr:WD40 repeat domain-containing protein [Crocosphaera sp.]
MDQWINLFVKVSKPVLTSILYTGINSWLEVFQEELTQVHKQQAKNTIKSLIVSETTLDEKEKSTTSFGSPKRSYCPEEKGWPLRLSSQRLWQKLSNDGHDLLFLLATPNNTVPEFFALEFQPSDFEQRLSHNLREFIHKNYSFRGANKGITFLGGLWNQSHCYGETSIQLLFEQLYGTSCFLLQTEIQGKEIKFNLVYWRKNATKYHYGNIFSFDYQSFLSESINKRIKQWQETRHQLLKLGKSKKDLERLGGICEKNYVLFEELEALKAAGINRKNLNVNYQFDHQDYESLYQFLSFSHCLLVGWIADIHYLINDNISPLLPQWLSSLGQTFSHVQFQPNILDLTISFYEDILTILGHESPHDVPELALKLAESLMDYSDKTWAVELLIYSFTCWQQYHQELDKLSPEILPLFYNGLSQKDQEYLQHLQQCLSHVTDYERTQEIQEFFTYFTKSLTNIVLSQTDINHFQLQRTITTISEKVLILKNQNRGYQLISQRDLNCLKVWDYEPEKTTLFLEHDLGKYAGQLSAVTLSQDGQFLASSETTETRSYLKIWQLSTGKVYRTLFGHRQPIQAIAIHLGNHSFIATGSHKIKLWNLVTGESWLTLFGHKKAVSCLAISPDGKILISGSLDASLRIWDLKTGNLIKILTGHQGSVTTLIISEDGQTILSGSKDKTIKLWDLKTGKLLKTLRGHLGGLQTFCLYYCYLFAGDETGNIYLWDLKTGDLLNNWLAHQQPIQAIAISKDGQTLISGCRGGKVQLWINQTESINN